jgi:hypothetical protein
MACGLWDNRFEKVMRVEGVDAATAYLYAHLSRHADRLSGTRLVRGEFENGNQDAGGG